MLIEFRLKNYRSFRDEAVLSMEAIGLGAFRNSLITFGSTKLIPGAAIFGKNGGGKSNVIRAFWLAVQFIKNAQRTQHEKAVIPVVPFLLNDYSKQEPTEFNFVYIVDGIKYWYGFSATRERICFSRDYSDIPRQLLDYSGDANMLKAISDYAKAADFGMNLPGHALTSVL